MPAEIGIVYQVQPEPPDPDHCTEFPAGAVTFILEDREVDPASLAKSYAGNEAALAEIEKHSPDGGFYDCGVSVHVIGASDGHEYLRFDVFDGDPHYHYVRPSLDHNHWVPFDAVAGGDMLPFVVSCLRERLAEMLTEAGGAAVAAELGNQDISPVIDRVAEAAFAARAHQRSLRNPSS